MKLLERLSSSPYLKNKFDSRILDHIMSLIFSVKLKKGDILVYEGEVCDKMFYIEKGLIRLFSDKDGVEVSTWFVSEGQFVSPISSFQLEVPSHETMEALEDCVVYGIKKKLYIQLIGMSNRFAMFSVVELMQNLCEFQNQTILLRTLNSEQKYLFLKKNYPTLLERVSQKHLASFLGVEVTYLSRVIKKFKVK
jgi:CRP-like cAMP-binding protein